VGWRGAFVSIDAGQRQHGETARIDAKAPIGAALLPAMPRP
jgi:hypothetical protein